MKDFNKSVLRKGMTYIEVISAVAIFTMFGSSLFLTQSYLFNRIEVAQWQLFADDRMRSMLINYQLEATKSMMQKQPLDEKKQEKDFTNPDMKITLEFVGKKDKSSLEKFAQTKLVKVSASDEGNRSAVSYSFMYVPDFNEEEKS